MPGAMMPDAAMVMTDGCREDNIDSVELPMAEVSRRQPLRVGPGIAALTSLTAGTVGPRPATFAWASFGLQGAGAAAEPLPLPCPCCRSSWRA